MTRLLKFDIIHPLPWLVAQQRALPNLSELTLPEYRAWLLSLASNYADFYTYPLNQQRDWVAEEYFLGDPIYTRKVAEWLWGRPRARAAELWYRGVGKLLGRPRYWKEWVVDRYIRHFRPDVLFVRSHPLPSRFWQTYRPETLLVARLSARLPYHWHPNDWDLLFTDQPDFKTFLSLHGVPTVLNDQGFDSRVADRLRPSSQDAGVVFVGGLGTENFLQRTEFFERIATRTAFKWWGYWWSHGDDGRQLADFPALYRTFQGRTSGMEMYQTYHDAAICLNDYVDTANGIGFNQRMFEVMGAGGFLLTRRAPNFGEHFEAGLFATYTDEADCLAKINYYLERPAERRAIADRGQAYVHEHYNYQKIALAFGEIVRTALDRKRTASGQAISAK